MQHRHGSSHIIVGHDLKKRLDQGERRPPDFVLKKFVPAFKPGLVTGVSLTLGLQWSNQCNSGEVGNCCA
jgi:hypothetical protein